ncbi:unnamed protein product [Fusarium graminearum]|nr:unnamed protein product [Fusarium graminearum]CAG1975243.1 unnamed protein product [Fusarium graminearum]VTO83704.1 unnamed protein product [Fusarium graminearum]
MQVVLDNLSRRQSQPLRYRDVRELGRLENLKENQIRVSGVLDIVAVGSWDVSNSSGCKVKGACRLGCFEDGHAAASLEEVAPFIGSRVPVDFADCSGLDHDKSG